MLAGGALLSYDLIDFRQTLAVRLASFADLVGYNSASAIVFNDRAAALQTLSALKTRSDVVAASLYNAQGELFAQWAKGAPASFDFPPAQGIGAKSTRFGPGYVEVRHPILLDGTPVGAVFVHSDLSERSRRLRRYALILLVVFVISALLAAGVALRIGRLITAPVLALVGVARRVLDAKDYSVRAEEAAGGEIGLLLRTFNEMLAQIQFRDEALRRTHDELEQKVVERTAELGRKEEELYQSRKMESVGRLAGGVAHDFNNLLTGILGCSEALEGALKPSDPHWIDVMEIKKASERAAGLTRQLLAFGRKQIISPQRVDLNAAVSQTIKLLRRLIGEDIEIVTTFDPALGAIRADTGQVDQVLINIAVNARDAMPGGGRLTIKTSNARLEANAFSFDAAAGEYVMLSISDTGHGMTKEISRRSLSPSLRRKNRGKARGSGWRPSTASSSKTGAP